MEYLFFLVLYSWLLGKYDLWVTLDIASRSPAQKWG